MIYSKELWVSLKLWISNNIICKIIWIIKKKFYYLVLEFVHIVLYDK